MKKYFSRNFSKSNFGQKRFSILMTNTYIWTHQSHFAQKGTVPGPPNEGFWPKMPKILIFMKEIFSMIFSMSNFYIFILCWSKVKYIYQWFHYVLMLGMMSLYSADFSVITRLVLVLYYIISHYILFYFILSYSNP